MTTVTQHKESLSKALAGLDSASQLIFGAWCCIALTADDAVFDFLSRYSPLSSLEIQTRVVHGLNDVWHGVEAAADFSDLTIGEWDIDDVSMADDSVAQGATDLLGALSFLSAWIKSRNLIELVSCAENVINRVDYLEGFDLLAGRIVDPVTNEMLAQTSFVSDLTRGLIGDGDKRKYHEWLFS
jgi:hypothetical protein